MPPVQEELLLTDTEQTCDQRVQGLQRKKTRSQEDSESNQVARSGTTPVPLPLWYMSAGRNRALTTW